MRSERTESLIPLGTELEQCSVSIVKMTGFP